VFRVSYVSCVFSVLIGSFPAPALSHSCLVSLMSYTCFPPCILCQSFPCLLLDYRQKFLALFPSSGPCSWFCLLTLTPDPACPEPGFSACPFWTLLFFCKLFCLIKECIFLLFILHPACLSAPEPHPVTIKTEKTQRRHRRNRTGCYNLTQSLIQILQQLRHILVSSNMNILHFIS